MRPSSALATAAKGAARPPAGGGRRVPLAVVVCRVAGMRAGPWRTPLTAR